MITLPKAVMNDTFAQIEFAETSIAFQSRSKDELGVESRRPRAPENPKSLEGFSPNQN